MKKIKKLSFCFGLTMLVLGFTIGAGIFLTACGHQHKFSAWSVETPATCTESGQEKRVCEECGEEETREIAAKGHESFVSEQGRSATCEEAGITDLVICLNCNTVLQEQQPIMPLGHKMSQWASLKDENSNDCDGMHESHCLNDGCDERIEEVCVYDTVEVPPTCTTAGHHEHECPLCHDHVSHDYTPELGHNWTGVWEAAGMDENGKYIHTQRCLRTDCGEVKTEFCHFDEEHMVEKQATCTESGTKTYTCTDENCNQQKVVVTAAATGHEWPETWQYSQTHEGYHEHKCNNCNEIERNLCTPDFTYVEANCTQEEKTIATCSVCQNVVETKTNDALGHSWSSTYEHKDGTTKENGRHVRRCTMCGVEDEPENCSAFISTEKNDATCNTDGFTQEHCSRCQHVYSATEQEALGHDYGPWSYFGMHDGKESHVQTCQRDGCGHQNFEACAYTLQMTTNPDCTNKGQKTGTCTTEGCGHEFTEEVPELGHLWAEPGKDQDEWTIDNENQTHTHTCKRPNCKASETGAHTYSQTNFCDSCGNDGLEYIVENGHAAVLRDNRVLGAKKIEIAELYQGLPVEEILAGLDSRDGLTSGFYHNSAVQEIVLPKTLKYIRAYAFENCDNLKNVSVKLSGDEQSSLIEIGAYAFGFCNNLSTAHFPNGLTTIAHHAFAGCTALADIVIPQSVTSIGNHAFQNTAFVKDRQHWTGEVLYINKHLIRASANLVGHYDVLADTISISAEAFNDCTGLSSISLPASLVDIGKDAFKNCVLLTSVTFAGDFAQWIGIDFENDYASPMSHASSLTILGAHDSISIPETATIVPAGAFKGTNITSVHIPKTVTRIDEEAFEGCESLATVTWDEDCKLEYVGRNAFSGTAFLNNALQENGVLYVGHCLVATNENIQVAEGGKYEVTEGTISIAPGAFEKNQVVKFVVLPESLQFIGEKAFSGSALEKAEFKNPRGWFAFMLQGAGRSPSADILGAAGQEEPEKDGNRRKAAELLTGMYQSVWRKTLKFEE